MWFRLETDSGRPRGASRSREAPAAPVSFRDPCFSAPLSLPFSLPADLPVLKMSSTDKDKDGLMLLLTKEPHRDVNSECLTYLPILRQLPKGDSSVQWLWASIALTTGSDSLSRNTESESLPPGEVLLLPSLLQVECHSSKSHARFTLQS